MVKEKKRYLLFEIKWAQERNTNENDESTNTGPTTAEKAFRKAITSSLDKNFGAWGTSCAYSVKIFNDVTNIGILRTDHNRFRMVWAALTLITSIQDIPVSITVLHVGGTMKQCERFGIKYDRAFLAAVNLKDLNLTKKAGDESDESDASTASDEGDNMTL